MKQQIKSRLKDWVSKNYHSVNDFADAMKISQPHASMLINGNAGIGNKTQQKLRGLGCDIEWLMTGKTKTEYALQEENSELLKLREENEKLRIERDALSRSLSPEVVRVILSGVKYPSTRKSSHLKK